MLALGYKLSSEEHAPLDLVRYAQMAQDSGFGFALISDHYHPWIDKQGQSPFVWGVIGAIAQATQRLTVGTAVTCPTTRLHPAIVAQAAATAAALMPARFFPGVGTGENLVTEEQVAESITCGPDPARHLAAIRKYAEAGYDHICVHQVGKDQKAFFEFYADEIFPQLRTLRAPRGRRRGKAQGRRKS
jgi:alkanesulfonate monooxygenase SsuD/methylene tetrahydromethanopterin reductase-like flavin-dependent oxidoreductase (luciferase family)